MIDWYQYWNSKPLAVADDDFLRQVGWTVGGQPIGDDAVAAIASDVAHGLDLRPDDSLLDLCCGNGLLTVRCAAHCRDVTGVDFSAPLIRIARDRFAAPNVRYVLADVRALPESVTADAYTKVVMYGAVQHLSSGEFESLLDRLRRTGAGQAPAFIGAVPDRDRIWHFYDTEERRREYARRVKDGTEAIGHWWTAADLLTIGRRRGYDVDIRPQRSTLPTAHYRFDALFVPMHG